MLKPSITGPAKMGLLLTAVIGWLLVASSHVLLSALPLRLQEREVATIPSYVLDYGMPDSLCEAFPNCADPHL